jgi:hypothetical protein
MKCSTPDLVPPGPWQSDGNTVYALHHGKHYTIARANGARLTDESQAATARFISKGPDIAEALGRLLQDMETPRSAKASEAWDHARAVLMLAGLQP